jgi:linoleoyl-CoA desaturase
VHELKTTANFATNNKVVSWLVERLLNFPDLEHHLFPKIVTGYIIQRYARSSGRPVRIMGISYIEYTKSALCYSSASHVALFLRQMGERLTVNW